MTLRARTDLFAERIPEPLSAESIRLLFDEVRVGLGLPARVIQAEADPAYMTRARDKLPERNEP